MRRFENSSTNKYWTVTVTGSTVETETGRIGSSSRPKVTHFADAAAAEAEASRQIEKRQARGFALVDGAAVRIKPAASPMPTPAATPAPTAAPSIAVAEGAHTVTLTVCGPRKISVIKTIREFTGLGLKDSKDLAESTPAVLKTGISRDEADALVAAIAESGGNAIVDGESLSPSAGPTAGAYDVVLVDTGDRKISVIKTIREFTGLGLRESKDLADDPPSVILRSVDVETAERCAAAIADCGGRTRLDAGDSLPLGSVDEVALVLTATGPKLIEIIKLVRYASGKGLKDSKDIADAPPGVISDRIERLKAEDFVQKIREAGGDARIDD